MDSTAPTKPTGRPITSAGRGAPASMASSNANRAVGALPIATTAPSMRARQSATCAAERVVPIEAASPGRRGSSIRQTTSLAAGRREAMIPRATICTSHRIGAPPASAARPASTAPSLSEIASATSTMPQAWMTRIASACAARGRCERSASPRIVAKDWA